MTSRDYGRAEIDWEGQMKTDEQYVAEFVALFEKHLTWNNQRVMDMFKADHGSMNEDEVVRLFNKWVRKGKIPLR